MCFFIWIVMQGGVVIAQVEENTRAMGDMLD